MPTQYQQYSISERWQFFKLLLRAKTSAGVLYLRPLTHTDWRRIRAQKAQLRFPVQASSPVSGYSDPEFGFKLTTATDALSDSLLEQDNFPANL